MTPTILHVTRVFRVSRLEVRELPSLPKIGAQPGGQNRTFQTDAVSVYDFALLHCLVVFVLSGRAPCQFEPFWCSQVRTV